MLGILDGMLMGFPKIILEETATPRTHVPFLNLLSPDRPTYSLGQVFCRQFFFCLEWAQTLLPHLPQK